MHFRKFWGGNIIVVEESMSKIYLKECRGDKENCLKQFYTHQPNKQYCDSRCRYNSILESNRKSRKKYYQNNKKKSILSQLGTTTLSKHPNHDFEREKEIIKNAAKIPVHFKLITLVSILIMCLGFIFFIYGKLSLQLSVYLPIFFILICCIIILFSREISFKSIISLILFSNIFFISSFMIVLNHQNGNYFVFLLIIHFILLSSSACFFKLNNNFSESKDICYSNEFISLLFFSTALIFIFINNILSFEIPKQFVTYISVFVIFFVCYLVYYNYKILANIKNSEINGDHV